MFKVMQLSHWKFKATAQSNTKMFDFPICSFSFFPKIHNVKKLKTEV